MEIALYRSVHNLVLEGELPHHALTNLGNKHGPFMHLQLGEISTIVVSSMDMTREVLKTHDLAFASRHKLVTTDMIFYKSMDIASSLWRLLERGAQNMCLGTFHCQEHTVV